MNLNRALESLEVVDVREILYKLDNITNYLYGQITQIDDNVLRRRVISDEGLCMLVLAYKLISGINIDADLPRMLADSEDGDGDGGDGDDDGDDG